MNNPGLFARQELAVTGLRLRHIYGYCCILCLATAFPFILGLWLAS